MIECSRRIYGSLQDDLSRQIFLWRCTYSISDDIHDILPLLKTDSVAKRLYDIKAGDNDYIFGCGYYGHALVKSFKNKWKGFIDNSEKLWGKNDVLPIFSPNDINRNARIFIANRYHHREIIKQLRESGFSAAQLINVGEMIEEMAEKQYFDLTEMPHVDEEVFADIGALNGDTSKLFIKWCKGEFRHIYCFEPDERNIDKCKVNLATELNNGKVTLIPKGAWNKTGKMSFVQQANGTSMIGDDGEVSINTITMDEALTGKNVTFIKMDIEGAEYPALQAAEEVIKNDKPKLAISVYHCSEDILRIPELILRYNPNYRLYLRHYSPFENETILYAI